MRETERETEGEIDSVQSGERGNHGNKRKVQKKRETKGFDLKRMKLGRKRKVIRAEICNCEARGEIQRTKDSTAKGLWFCLAVIHWQ